jgi:hypothetical protein
LACAATCSDDAARTDCDRTGTTALLNSGARRCRYGRDRRHGERVAQSRDGGVTFTLTQRDDRKAISAVLSGDGALIVAGEGGGGDCRCPAEPP